MVDGASDAGDAPRVDSGTVDADPIYVYALVRPDSSLVLPVMGVDSQRPVELLSTGAVAAVYSTVRHELFNEAAIEAGLRNRAWLEAHVLVHQQVIDALVASGAPVIPMRFCTLYRDREAVVEILSRHALTLTAELERLEGRQEWGVKQVVDVAALQAALARGDEALAVAADDSIEQLRHQIAGMSPGAAYLLKKKLASLIADRAQSIAFGVADTVHLALSEKAVEAVTNPLPQDRPDVCLNGAYLVELPKIGEFVTTLEAAGSQYASAGISFELSGPWPAYHFLSLDLSEPGQ